jgi:hypothetical protein
MKRIGHQRLGTFDLSGVADGDLEKAWNDWTTMLLGRGLRPAEHAVRSTETSATFRLFQVEHEEQEFTLDFDIAKLGALAATVMTGAAFAASFFDPHVPWTAFLSAFFPDTWPAA